MLTASDKHTYLQLISIIFKKASLQQRITKIAKSRIIE